MLLKNQSLPDMRFTLLAVVWLFWKVGLAQEAEEPKKLLINGYVKDLVTINFPSDSTLIDNLIHNRINLKWFPNENFNVILEVRNRFFVGDLVETFPNYPDLVDVNNDYLDLSVHYPEDDSNSYLFHSMIDRLYVEWHQNNWELRLGRHRINWGMNLVWNPNDLFNAYSFFDFDYEERPGSDAIRIKRYLGHASSAEFAMSFADNFDETVIMAMWRTNKWNYDIQLLAGKAREDISAGIGWAGNIKNSGLKGEITYFQPYVDDRSAALLLAVSFDHSFKNSLYFNSSFMFNTDGSDDELLQFSGQTDRLTARDLSPFKYSNLLQISYPLNPLMNASFAAIYYPGDRNALFLNPVLGYSLSSSFDISLVGQFYFDKLNGDYDAMGKVLFARVKWSF